MRIKWSLIFVAVFIFSFACGIFLRGCEQARGAEMRQELSTGGASNEEFFIHLGQVSSFIQQAGEAEYEFNCHRRGFENESIFVGENQRYEYLDWAVIKLNVLSVLVQKLTIETEFMIKAIDSISEEKYGSVLINQARDVIRYVGELAIKQKEYLQWYDGLFKKQ